MAVVVLVVVRKHKSVVVVAEENAYERSPRMRRAS
jgi:hypothetical protein